VAPGLLVQGLVELELVGPLLLHPDSTVTTAATTLTATVSLDFDFISLTPILSLLENSRPSNAIAPAPSRILRPRTDCPRDE
jgi:hypothetical protein